MKFRLFYPPIYITVIMSLLLILSAAVSLNSIKELNSSRIRLSDAYKLQRDVLVANIALRNAAIAPDSASREQELAKMLITRNDATDIYDKLSIISLDRESLQILNDLKQERVEYRTNQTNIIFLIRSRVNDSILWHKIYYYQTLMDRYLYRLDRLIQLSEQNAKEVRSKTITAILSTCILSLLALIFVIARSIRLK